MTGALLSVAAGGLLAYIVTWALCRALAGVRLLLMRLRVARMRQLVARERAGLARLAAAVRALPEDRLVIEPLPETFARALASFRQKGRQEARAQARVSFFCGGIARECAAARMAGRN